MQDAFKKSQIHKSFVVLEKELVPLTLGHSLLLESHDSAFFTGESVNILELAFAAYVCALPYSTVKDLLNRENPKTIKKLTKECSKWGKKYRKKIKKGDIHIGEEILWFNEYLNYYLESPVSWSDSNEKNEGNAPWQLTVAAGLMKHLNMSQDEVLSQPLSWCISLYATLNEMMGGSKVLSQESVDVLERVKRIKAGQEVQQ